jgi:hypothetical protein
MKILKDAGLAIVAPFLSFGYIQKHQHIYIYHTSLYKNTKQKYSCKGLQVVRIRNSLIYLYLVLSTPRGTGKQGIRYTI